VDDNEPAEFEDFLKFADQVSEGGDLRDAAASNRESDIRESCLCGQLRFGGDLLFGNLGIGERANKDINAFGTERCHFVCEPVPAAWAGHGRKATGTVAVNRK
jgi:hypothetical protein